MYELSSSGIGVHARSYGNSSQGLAIEINIVCSIDLYKVCLIVCRCADVRSPLNGRTISQDAGNETIGCAAHIGWMESSSRDREILTLSASCHKHIAKTAKFERITGIGTTTAQVTAPLQTTDIRIEFGHNSILCPRKSCTENTRCDRQICRQGAAGNEDVICGIHDDLSSELVTIVVGEYIALIKAVIAASTKKGAPYDR